jgi:hypothetical protein
MSDEYLQLSHFDTLTQQQILDKLDALWTDHTYEADYGAMRRYEASHQNRGPILAKLDAILASPDAEIFDRGRDDDIP